MNNTVIVRTCEDYDPDKIEAMVSDGMDRLGYRPTGKVFAKPNVVVAFQTEKLGSHAYTPPSFVGAGLKAVSKMPGVKRIDVGENVAMGTPTRLAYEHAGYYNEIESARRAAGCPVDIFCIDEELRDTQFVGGVVHDTLRVARRMARADTKIYFPKLKCHCVAKMTGAVKLNIGICSDDERAIRHDFMLNEKIVDLLAVGMPDFIVMDAVDVGMGNEAFPTVRKLGLVLMGTNPIAVDMVAARLLGYTMEDVSYLALAIERGYSPASPDDIPIEGDLSSMDMIMKVSHRMGMPSPFRDPGFLMPYAKAMLAASFRKCISLRYLQDIVYFMERGLLRKI